MSEKRMPPGFCQRCGLRYPENDLREVRPGRSMCPQCRREWMRVDLKKEVGFKPGLRYQLVQCGRRWGKSWATKRAVEEAASDERIANECLAEIEAHPERVLSGPALETKMAEWEKEDDDGTPR